MAKAKKVKVVVDRFKEPFTEIFETKETKVVSNLTKWNLVEGQEYICLRKCKTRTDNIIFEIVNSDGVIETYGSIWFK